jgi:hypothetical protein
VNGSGKDREKIMESQGENFLEDLLKRLVTDCEKIVERPGKTEKGIL